MVLTSDEAHRYFIKQVIKDYLHRTPSVQEADVLATQMNGALNREGLVRYVLSSDEYYNRAR